MSTLSIDDRVAVICPECHQQVPVPITVRIEGTDHQPTVVATPDMTDLWAHAWTHTKGDS